MLCLPQGDRTGFRQTLRQLYRRLRGYPIWLYVDGARWHKSAAADTFLATHPRLRLEYLPRYQPGLNPPERVWRRLRYEATINRWFLCTGRDLDRGPPDRSFVVTADAHTSLSHRLMRLY